MDMIENRTFDEIKISNQEDETFDQPFAWLRNELNIGQAYKGF